MICPMRPTAGRKSSREFGRPPVPDWPFTILYQMTRRAVGVIAVFHTSRDPQEWIDRVCDFSMSTGLNSGSRHHVHLCSDEATTTRVGQRHGKPAILTIRAREMHSAGHEFFLSANEVWLTEIVPVVYIDSEIEP